MIGSSSCWKMSLCQDRTLPWEQNVLRRSDASLSTPYLSLLNCKYLLVWVFGILVELWLLDLLAVLMSSCFV